MPRRRNRSNHGGIQQRQQHTYATIENNVNDEQRCHRSARHQRPNELYKTTFNNTEYATQPGSMHWRKVQIIGKLEREHDADFLLRMNGLRERQRWFDDKSVVCAALRYCSRRRDCQISSIMENVSLRLRDNKDFAMSALLASPHFILPSHGYTSRNVARVIFRNLSDRLRDDREVAGIALKKSYLCLQFLSTRLKDDEQMVREPIIRGPQLIPYVSERLRDDFCFIRDMSIASRSIHVLRNASQRLQSSEKLVRAVASSDPSTLVFVANHLKDNKQFMTSLIERNHDCLRYASRRLKDDKDFILGIIHQVYRCLQLKPRSASMDDFISTHLWDDFDVAMAFIRIDRQMIWNLRKDMSSNPEIFVTALSNGCASGGRFPCSSMIEKLKKLDQEAGTLGLSSEHSSWEQIWLVSQLSIHNSSRCSNSSNRSSYNENYIDEEITSGNFDAGICRHICEFANLKLSVKVGKELKRHSEARAVLERYMQSEKESTS